MMHYEYVKTSPNIPQKALGAHSLDTWDRLLKTMKGLLWYPPCWIPLMSAANNQNYICVTPAACLSMKFGQKNPESQRNNIIILTKSEVRSDILKVDEINHGNQPSSLAKGGIPLVM